MSAENIYRVTDEERKAIRKLCTRTDEEINEDIKQLKEWISKQPHLPQDDDDNWLKMMLYYNKFSMEKTKQKVDMYHSVKNIVPEFFVDREPLHPTMDDSFKHFILLPLPNLHNLVRIYYHKFRDDGSKLNMLNIIKTFFCIFDLRMSHDNSIGEAYILDYDNITFAHIKQISPIQLKQFYNIGQKSYSDKIVNVDFINVPSIAATLVNLIISVFPAKLKSRVRVHKSTSDLLKFYSPEVLPNDLGGTAGTTDELYDKWLKFYKSKNIWVKEVGLRRSDESKRIGELLDSDMFGTCGSFRKLNID